MDGKFWANEKMRWSYVTNRQLLTRLNRITKEGKLECFIAMARRMGNYKLEEAALTRYYDLFGVGISDSHIRKEAAAVEYHAPIVRQIVELRVQKKVDEMDRALEF